MRRPTSSQGNTPSTPIRVSAARCATSYAQKIYRVCPLPKKKNLYRHCVFVHMIWQYCITENRSSGIVNLGAVWG